jgi:hypothetical protein
MFPVHVLKNKLNFWVRQIIFLIIFLDMNRFSVKTNESRFPKPGKLI